MVFMKIDPKVERIIEWRESFSSLPDDYFFDIIHIYLGEIKTPYNKPKLIEELGTILRKKENRETLVNYLDEKDVRILTAIKFIPEVDIEKLEKFFVPAMSQGDLYEEIASLEERLIIYNRENKLTGKKTIALNPHLEEDLEAVLDLGNLVAEEEGKFIREDTGIFSSPGVIAVFVSYILAHPDFCKSNGDLKKKTDSDLREICGIESTEIFQKLFVFRNHFAKNPVVHIKDRDSIGVGSTGIHVSKGNGTGNHGFNHAKSHMFFRISGSGKNSCKSSAAQIFCSGFFPYQKRDGK